MRLYLLFLLPTFAHAGNPLNELKDVGGHMTWWQALIVVAFSYGGLLVENRPASKNATI